MAPRRIPGCFRSAARTKRIRKLQRMQGPSTVQLVDTYDTIEGVKKVAALGPPLWGVRLDSGDFKTLSREARAILDQAGLHDAKIMLSGDLDEYAIRDLIADGAPVDSFGVGTQLATSADAPAMGTIYKLVELDVGCGIKRFTAKMSHDKTTLPGAKQLFRFDGHDILARSGECSNGQAMLRPVVLGGNLVEPLPDLNTARARAAAVSRQIARLAAQPRASRAMAGQIQQGSDCPHRAHPEKHRMKTVFVDIDTQIDFLFPAGALYVPGAERILPAIAQLNHYAVEHSMPLISTADAHSENDPEFRTWPPHCVAGTAGQSKPAGDTGGRRTDLHRKASAGCFHQSGFPCPARVSRRRSLCGLRRGNRLLRALRGYRFARHRQARRTGD